MNKSQHYAEEDDDFSVQKAIFDFLGSKSYQITDADLAAARKVVEEYASK